MSQVSVSRERVSAPAEPSPVVAWCAAVVQSRAFEIVIIVAIAANAVLLGIETYPDLGAARPWLHALELVFRCVFVAEIAIRAMTYARRPLDFFRSGWNVFDLLVIVLAFVPGLNGDSAVLRVVRIARVVRLMRFFPGLRTIVTALLRSLPGVGGFLALAAVTLYVYGMAGWLIFAEHYPEQYGTIGQAVLTLFLLLSLENLPDLVEQGLALSPWTLVYYISYVLITVNLLVNILVGVIINSMEEARRLEADEPPSAAPAPPVADPVPVNADRDAISRRIDHLRLLLDELEHDLRAAPEQARHADDGATERKPEPVGR